MSFKVSAFELTAPIAQGGMGQVWRGVHRSSGAPVAVKVLTGQITQQPRFREAFRNEARAMAGLDHPGIVRIYDYGEIPQGSEAIDHFGVGCPYLVMEWVDHALDRGLHISSWPVLKDVLLALLDALAHAHARGVVHRDLKPSNILVDANYTLKISDFGIAFAQGVDGVDIEQMRAAGTPEFMAPEQCHGLWRDFGPWTDLYALGCVAFTLTTGNPPFTGDTPMNTMLAKLEQEIPTLRPRFAIPEGFEVWVRRMLQRAPGHRFQRAADAAWALRGVSLDDETMRRISTGPLEMPPVKGGDTLAWFTEDTAVTGGFDVMSGSGAPATYSLEPNFEGTSTASLRATRAPIPVDWRSPRANRKTSPLMDVGLGLFGLRRTPLVDREEARDLLWRNLRLVHTTGEPRVVVLKGAAGSGKSRLVEWLCERSHELGAGTYLHARHAPEPGPAHGLGAMLMRHLRCNGLSRAELRDRLQGLVTAQGVADADEWEALTQLIAPAPVNDATGERHIRFTSLIERNLVLMRQLDRMARDRALVLWFDDVHYGYESLEFVSRVLERGDGAFLIGMTVREDDLPDRPIEDRLLESILEDPRCEEVHVGPLSQTHMELLVRGLLALEPELAHQVETRTAGNPYFAIQLVRDWVQRGLLEPGARGFHLVPGTVIELPADLREIWTQRIERLLASRSEADARVLELAAVLGAEVDEEEWSALCRLARVDIADDLREVLLRDRLIRPLDENEPELGWAFAHAMITDVLEVHAEAQGRLRAHHMICAGMLRARGASGARLGRHLRAAGNYYAALEPLRQSVELYLEVGDYRSAEAALLDWVDTLDQLDIPEVDRRWAEGHLLISRIAALRGDLDEADEQVAAAADEAMTYGWTDLAVLALVHRSSIACDQGHYPEGAEHAETAAGLLDEHDELELHATVNWHLGRVYGALGRYDIAQDTLSYAERAYRALGDPNRAAQSMLYQARTAVGNVDPAEVVALIEAAREELHAIGSRTGEADAIHDLGEVARLAGDLESAEHFYRDARELYETIGSANIIYAELNLAMVLLARGAFTEARLLIERVLEQAQAQGRKVIIAAASIMMLPPLARDRDWKAWDEHLAEGLEVLAELEIVDSDLARHAQIAAHMAQEQNQIGRALGAVQLAHSQWQALGRDESIAATRRMMRELSRANAWGNDEA